MEQIVVTKRGRWKRGHWSQRVLSLCPILGVAALSHKAQTDEHDRKCLHVTSMQMWPRYNEAHIREDATSMEAKLTLRVKGMAVLLGERVVTRADGPQVVYRYTQRDASEDQRAWMLRFSTFADLEKAVRLFQAFRPLSHPKTLTGTSPSPAQTSKEEAAVAFALENADTPAAACAEGRNDGDPLDDELVMAGVMSSSVVEGDVESDLASIRSQWEQFHHTGLALA
ncbi:hypothetical protein ABB37_09129 [Leptomonas pyrrhocoris]|uniref:Uncharacterized protein n=1 Tax=Leptomonas pyrrhocoris TaxID=157538 RepID=A0A0N0DRA8_LEPPY|nr:hypothetical protein ABB37_09129 [Leptomonas pyrrhocoris]XP_015652881.1 hypothetical protein ABB37_09129 [Leptomonas pyrrhocoris]KPA74441.1 hypothetical protein ABB37_09129 [Leptomonas pyrrhocoris]KPA74442.1 hypothetical protein ABB37_09129 [Leptomonas pyrrhocoris]|eukprot:XP_015652880.1 hypothetical protein ABB37_09129 [Leptomonas pyrrhocoris]